MRSQYDVVVIEGAGSPAEINLKANEIVNMRVALHANAPVLLVGDIDRGGVFASLVGTMELLDPPEKEVVKAFIVNKFRGDVSLLEPGLDWLEERTGVPVLGVVPYYQRHRDSGRGRRVPGRTQDAEIADRVLCWTLQCLAFPTYPTSTISTP